MLGEQGRKERVELYWLAGECGRWEGRRIISVERLASSLL